MLYPVGIACEVVDQPVLEQRRGGAPARVENASFHEVRGKLKPAAHFPHLARDVDILLHGLVALGVGDHDVDALALDGVNRALPVRRQMAVRELEQKQVGVLDAKARRRVEPHVGELLPVNLISQAQAHAVLLRMRLEGPIALCDKLCVEVGVLAMRGAHDVVDAGVPRGKQHLVGFQAEKVIEAVNAYRRDVTFVFNHDFAHTNTGDSVRLAAEHANEYVLTIDGDLLLHPEDMRKIIEADGEFVGVTAPGTDNPVLTDVADADVVGFSREHGQYEWTGVTQVKAEKIMNGSGHTYQLIEPYLPMPYMYLRTKEIDTPDDYDRAVRWVKGGYSDEVAVGIVGGMGSYATVGFFKRLVDAFPARYEWERPRILIDNRCTMPSRVRAILYGERRDELVRQLAESVKNLVGGGFHPCLSGMQHLARLPR